MSKGPTTITIRNAIINNSDRNEQLQDIMYNLDCSRYKAKELFFAFIYQANEDFLVHLLQRGENVE